MLSQLARYNEVGLVFKAVWAEYKNNPLLNIGFILSLAIATSTLLSILVLNHASKQEYQNANHDLKPPIAFYIVPKPGGMISKHDFVYLRKNGFHQLNGVQVFRKKLISGQSVSIRAMDILPLVVVDKSSFSSLTLNMHRDYAANLGLNSKSRVQLNSGEVFNIRLHDKAEWQDSALLDLSLAWQVFKQQPQYSYLIAGHMSEPEKSRLSGLLPEHLFIRDTWTMEERAGFADALHLNLTALAILGFIVSMFIAFQAANQAWRTRTQLTAQLRLLGVSLKSIGRVLIVEALLLTLTATLAGLLLAKLFTFFLLPLLGMTLKQIYNLQASGQLVWYWSYNLWALGITLVAVLAALAQQIKNITTAEVVLSSKPKVLPFNYKVCGLFTGVLLVVFVAFPTSGWTFLMFKYGLFLLASVAFLPIFIRFLLSGLSVVANSYTARFVFQDASLQVGRRFLPVAAFYLALTASIAAALMVKSFESSFVSYLEQILRSQAFISYSQSTDEKTKNWLGSDQQIESFVIFSQTTARVKQDTLLVYSLTSKEQLQGLYLKSGVKRPLTVSGAACYINEQLAFAHSVELNQDFAFVQGQQRVRCRVSGIYHDYGNQALAVRLVSKEQINSIGGWRISGYGVYFKTDEISAKQYIIDNVRLSEEEVFEPGQVKSMAISMFNQTFILTQAIGFVLLVVACFGLFLSANNLELARKSDLFVLRSLGYSRRSLFFHMLNQWLLIVILTMVLSWPVGIVLAHALVSMVLPASFGWSMPLEPGIGPFIFSSLLGLLILIPALVIPLHKLNVRENL